MRLCALLHFWWYLYRVQILRTMCIVSRICPDNLYISVYFNLFTFQLNFNISGWMNMIVIQFHAGELDEIDDADTCLFLISHFWQNVRSSFFSDESCPCWCQKFCFVYCTGKIFYWNYECFIKKVFSYLLVELSLRPLGLSSFKMN